MRKTVVCITAAAALPLLAVTSCSMQHRHAADEIGQHIQTLPGVQTAATKYDNSFDGGERFDLDVTLRPDVTGQQLRGVAVSFATRTVSAGITGGETELTLRLPKYPPQPDSVWVSNRHSAIFSIGRSATERPPSAQQIADGAAVWLRTAHSPTVAEVTVTAPSWGGGGDTRDVRIILAPGVTHAEAAALQFRDPALAQATWVISTRATPYRPYEYSVKPTPPSDAELQTWPQLSVLDGVSNLSGNTLNPVAAQMRGAATEVEADLPTGPDHEAADRRVAVAVAELLTRFGHPVALTARTPEAGIEVVIGGCYRHQSGHHASAWETELSRRFERC